MSPKRNSTGGTPGGTPSDTPTGVTPVPRRGGSPSPLSFGGDPLLRPVTTDPTGEVLSEVPHLHTGHHTTTPEGTHGHTATTTPLAPRRLARLDLPRPTAPSHPRLPQSNPHPHRPLPTLRRTTTSALRHQDRHRVRRTSQSQVPQQPLTDVGLQHLMDGV